MGFVQCLRQILFRIFPYFQRYQSQMFAPKSFATQNMFGTFLRKANYVILLEGNSCFYDHRIC